jgi:branched chain amino acid efflux pump
MCSERRTGTLLAQVLLMGATIGAIGVSFGALAVAAGMSPAAACVMSLLVFAGGSQFAAIGVIGAGGSPVAAIASALLLNARYVGFGLAVAPRIRGSFGRRLFAAHVLIDESGALALAQRDPERARRAFWWSGIAVFVLWNAGTAIGALAGSALGDPRAIGLDAAAPAGILALVLPSLATRRQRIAAVAGALIAITLTPILPPGLPVLAAAFAPFVALAIPEPVEVLV